MKIDVEQSNAIIAACLEMNANGLNQGTSGNISVRSGEGVLITPTSLPYNKMTSDDMVWVGFNGEVKGSRLPSTEWQFHVDIIRERPDVNAVVHAHPLGCTSLAIMGKDIPAVHYMVAVCGGHDIRCAPYATFGTKELSDNALLALKDRTACLLDHHGMIAVGKTLDQAMWRAVEVETLANQYLTCLQFGEPPLLSEEEIHNVLYRMENYGHKG